MHKRKIKVIVIMLLCLSIITAIVLGVLGYKHKNTKKLLIVGDSIGEGAGCSDPAFKWYKYLPPYMEEQYDIQLEITNVSMGGNTSYAGYVRTMNLDKEDVEFDYIVICYGQNDSTEDFSLYYETLIRTIKSKYPSAVVIAILESSQREYTEKMQTIQELCEYYGIYIADTIAAFNESGIPYEQLCDDGIHPNDEGQKLYFETVIDVLDQCWNKSNADGTELATINKETEAFESYQYWALEEFKKVDELKYELEVDKEISGILGIDYTLITGENRIQLYVDGEEIATKKLLWDKGFVLRYIEVVSDNFTVNETITLEFQNEAQAEEFHGIAISGLGKHT